MKEKKKSNIQNNINSDNPIEKESTEESDLIKDLITSLNKEHGHKIAYNLSIDEAPTIVKRWISTGSKLLDYAIACKKGGGLPEGRIIEIFGPPSTGKSHLALQACISTQKMGGIVVYIDTENATSIENLQNLGVDIKRRFVFVETSCTEDVFSTIESTILKMKTLKKDVPVLVVWDSVAATSPKKELLGEYDQETIGLQARAISKGMRKITNVVGDNNVTLLCLNQTRMKIGVMFGDPTTTPGGMAIPFHASVRISLSGGSKIENKNGDVVGINVIAKIIKNKVATPHKRVEYKIIFGKGIDESEQIFDLLKEKSPVVLDNKTKVVVSGEGAWKTIVVTDVDGVVLEEKKFTKAQFEEIINDSKFSNYIELCIDKINVSQDLSEEMPIIPINEN